MILHRIDYNEGDIWVDDRIVSKGDIVIHSVTGEVRFDFSEEVFGKSYWNTIIAQSPNLSLPNIPYVEAEEDFYSELIRLLFRITDENVPLFGSNRLQSLHNDVGALLERLLAMPVRKYTEEDLRKAFRAGVERGVNNALNGVEVRLHVSNEDEYIQSLQPKVASIEIEVEDIFEHNPKFTTPKTYTKAGKRFLRVKKAYDKNNNPVEDFNQDPLYRAFIQDDIIKPN